MNPVLQKTVQSLESALRYNPANVELMTSLAEVYIRMGRFDERTMELCEAVLNLQIDNALLQQAQSIGLLIEQSREIEKTIAEGGAAPSGEALEDSIDSLENFLEHNTECLDAELACVRFQLLLGRFDQARARIERLKSRNVENLGEDLRLCLVHAERMKDLDALQADHLVDLYFEFCAPDRAIALAEQFYDKGIEGMLPRLREHYLNRYSPSRPEEVPEALRERLFNILIDHTDPEIANEWFRMATRHGWEISTFSRSYAHMLVTENRLDEAFSVLRCVSMSGEVKDLLNEISARYEACDDLDKAVGVLRYINDHQLVEEDVDRRHEQELASEAEVSMGEYQIKNGRFDDALNMFVSAICRLDEVDVLILERIDELLQQQQIDQSEPLFRLGVYLRRGGDNPKAVYYLNRALDIDPGNREILGELESLFDEILALNPDLPELRLELGLLYLKTGRTAEAIEALEQASQCPSLTDQAKRPLAEAYLQADRPHDALAIYRTIQVAGEDLDNLYRLHENFLNRDETREALVALDLISYTQTNFRDVREKKTLLQDRIGKLQPEVVVDAKMRELIGDLAVGRYQHLERVGSGGMGVVHKVYDIRNQQTVAMKILRDGLGGSSKALDRFFREARIAATLQHRNIVKIFDYNISNLNGQSYIVMEYVDGASLREIIDRQFEDTVVTSLDYVAEVLYYTAQLCDALDAAHDKGIIHRDIKPDNIMINTSGEVKITDFGIVHIEEATFTPCGAMLGTPRYMSPEQVNGTKIDARSDLYSAGIVLYESLVGSPPFMTGDISYQQIHNTPLPPRQINQAIPQACADMIVKCLKKNPEERFRTAREMRDALLEMLDAVGGCSKYAAQTCVDTIDAVGKDSELDLE